MTETKTSKFKWVLLGISALLIVIISIFLMGLWSYLVDFEKNTPQNVILDYVDLLKNEKFEQAFEIAGYKENPMANLVGFTNYIKTAFADGYDDIKAYDTTSAQSSNSEYEVYVNNKKAIKLSLSPSGKVSKHKFPKFNISFLGIKEYEQLIIAPANINIYVNGNLATASEEPTAFKELNYFNAINDVKQRPTVQSCKAKTLFAKPVISAKRTDGSEVAITVKDKDDQTIVYLQADEKLNKEHCERALEYSKKYAAFITNDVKFKTLSENILKDTSYYKELSGYYGGWCLPHEKHNWENPIATDLVLYGDDAFTVNTQFNYVITREGKVTNYDTKYKVCYIKVDGNWKVANLVVR